MPSHNAGLKSHAGLEAETPWWQRADLRYVEGTLHLADTDLNALAARMGTPLYVYSGPRAAANLARLHDALTAAGLDYRVLYAMKANRSPSLLTYLQTTGLCGIDACSLNELHRAICCGFRASQISFTGTSLTRSDYNALAWHPEVAVNADSLHALDAIGRRCPGRAVGLRINPAVGVGYGGNEMLRYSGARTTKFGVYSEQFDAALRIADTHGLRIERIHFHAGSGYLSEGLDQFHSVLEASVPFLARLPALREVNVGGGLGVPHRAADRPLDLRRWASILAAYQSQHGATIVVEPGDYVVKDAGVLLAEVTYAERRRETLFLGIDAGFNLAMEPVFYDLPCEPVPCREPEQASRQIATIVGNINEALDAWALDRPLPAMQAGERLALLNAGGYAAAMASHHCMLGEAAEVLLLD